MRYDAKISLAYQQDRPYLVDLAFRMLGDIGAAQDTVQDAFSRLLRSELDEIEDLRAWLTERCGFVLHDIFAMPFAEVAQAVGRTVVSCRQLARRARQKITSGRDGVRFDIASAEHRQVTETFIAACASGDLDALLSVLAPDAWGLIDFGPDATPRQFTQAGAGRVAANLLAFWGPPATLVSHPIAGQPALLGFNGRDLAGVLVLALRGELVESITVIGDSRQLAYLSGQLVTFPRGISSLPEELMLARTGEEKQ